MRLSPQKQYLYNLLKSGEWVCSNLIDGKIVRDYRKRLSEMCREGFTIESLPCDGACKIAHKAGVHMYRMGDLPVKPTMYLKNPLTGERMTVEEYRKL